MRKTLSVLVATVLGLGLTACDPGVPQESEKYQLKETADQLSTEEYNKMTPLEQYQVANKLTGALFKGVAANEFFVPETITADDTKLKVSLDSKDYLAKVQRALTTPLATKDQIVLEIEGDTEAGITGKYAFDETRKPLQYPLAYMYEMPLSDEYFARWMAYKLVNTIMFSPAEEIDSASETDVQKIYEGLVAAIKANASVRSIILTHQKSEANWRRFRSPEDNTREMIEIYLGLFDRDDDVPKAAIACKNWSLTDEDAGYELQIAPTENTTPQQILDGYYVTTCNDFFEVIANHPLVIPRVTTVLIDHMFGVEYDSEKRSALARDIAASSPTTFKDIFLAILFSEEFLLNMERPKWFEESFFNVADRVKWRPYNNFFRDVTNTTTNTSINASLPLMYQPAFSLKLGRWPTVPQDVLAVSYQHNGLRAPMLVRQTDPLNASQTGWGPEFVQDAVYLSTEDFISYMFISVIGRMPTEAETSTLKQVIETARTQATADSVNCTQSPVPAGCQGLFQASATANRAMAVMDYLTRLPELYFYNAVN